MRGFLLAMATCALVLTAMAEAQARETERLDTSAEIFILNATSLSVDVYVNYEAQPTLSDPRPLVSGDASGDEMTPNVFVVHGTFARPYGAYTFQVRPKGDPTADLLAAASIDLEQGHSFAGVFHPAPGGGYRFSIYENELSPSVNGRMTVRNTTTETVSWRIFPNGEVPDVPPDERSGTLEPGEWQTAKDIVDNDYVIEYFVDGERVGWFPDLDLAAAKTFNVYVLGELQPSSSPDVLQRPVAFEELEFDPGPRDERVVTAPAPPLSTTDGNAPVQFTCEPVTIWETDTITAPVAVRDPDGVVNALAVDRVDPPVGGIAIVDGAFTPSAGIGEPATAHVTVAGGVPDGLYTVWIAANRGTSGQQAACALQLTVQPITVERLLDQVEAYRRAGGIQAAPADALRFTLLSAQLHLQEGRVADACSDLERVLSEIGAEKGKAISDAAADDLAAETTALRTDLHC
jgi:hypothetical protein